MNKSKLVVAPAALKADAKSLKDKNEERWVTIGLIGTPQVCRDVAALEARRLRHNFLAALPPASGTTGSIALFLKSV